MVDGSPDGAIPELSVIVPCWNAADSIERAIGSVLGDHETSLECVVVDDGSTDGSPAILERLAAADPRVVVIRVPENAGASAARNLALERSRGTWLTFLDADDILTEGGVAALMRPTRTTDALAVIGQRIWDDGTRTWVSGLYDIPDIREPGRKSIASAPGLVYYASATGKALHRSLVGDLRFEGRVLGDQPWTLRALLRAGDRIEVIADDVYVWLRQATELSDPRSITATSRSTARGSAGAVRVAITAHEQVSAEARRTIADPVAQRLVSRVYLERLLRSDLGMYLKRALDRRDPDVAVLLVAFADFLESVPRDLLAEVSPVVVKALYKPLLDAWPWLPPSARDAFWEHPAAGRRRRSERLPPARGRPDGPGRDAARPGGRHRADPVARVRGGGPGCDGARAIRGHGATGPGPLEVLLARRRLEPRSLAQGVLAAHPREQVVGDAAAGVARLEVERQERLAVGLAQDLAPRPVEHREHVRARPDRDRDARVDIAEQVRAGEARREQVRRAGRDRLGQQRRVDPEVGVGGGEEPVEVDRLDDGDRRRSEPAGRREALDDRAVRAFVLLGGVELDDDVHPLQRPVEQLGERDRIVEPPLLDGPTSPTARSSGRPARCPAPA